MVSPLARRAEGGALPPQRVCLSVGEPGGRTTRATPLFTGAHGRSLEAAWENCAVGYKNVGGVASLRDAEHATHGTVAA